MSFSSRLKKERREFAALVRSTPALVTAIFAVSLVAMNLLANKSIDTGVDWLALDCGITVSWVAFLTMDVLTKHFGPKAATELSVLAMLISLGVCLLFFLASLIPGVWSASFNESGEAVNTALDGTFGGTWYVVIGSAAAFIASAFVNNFLNFAVGKLFRKNGDGAAAYFVRSYVSTAVGQFVDNLVFAFAVGMVFFDWSAVQCATCAATGMVAELLCEVAFSYFGYRVCARWKRTGVGEEYLALVAYKGDTPPLPRGEGE